MTCIALMLGSLVSAQQPVIDIERSQITIHTFKSGIFSMFGDDHVIAAYLSEGSLGGSGTPHVDIVVDTRRMRVLDPGLSPKDRAEVQSRMLGPDVLDASRFTVIRFRSDRIEAVGTNQWIVRGDLTLHGQTRGVMARVTLADGHYKGSAAFRQSEFGIKPISIAGGTVRVKDEIKVEFDIATSLQR